MTGWLRKYRRALSDTVYCAMAAAALAGAFLLRFEFALEPRHVRMLGAAVPVAMAIKFVVFRLFGTRDSSWRLFGFADLWRVVAANICASGACAVGMLAVIGKGFPRSVCVLDLLLCTLFLAAAHAVARVVLERETQGSAWCAPFWCAPFPTWSRIARPGRTGKRRRILIYGAGKAGVTVLSEIRAHPELNLEAVGFIDDDPSKQNLRVHGLRVLGTGAQLTQVARAFLADEVLVAAPAATGTELARILERCHAARIATKEIPPLAELIEGRVLVNQRREVRLEDLLGRDAVTLDESQIHEVLAGKVVLVTGAGGSIGSELCRQAARFSPAALVGLDHAETAMYEIDREMRERFPHVAFHPEVATIRNRHRLDEIFRRYSPDVIYHAAAYKHVPLMESHPFEAIENNVFGTANVAEGARKHGVGTFVLISSDKAVSPGNIMGATKRLAEMICLAEGGSSPALRGREPARFMAVRFGNVLGSNGSVIPLFRRQIEAGGPVTVTHPDMRRFFMTIPEAAQLVLQASAMGKGGEIFGLEMGAPVKIDDLARKMVLLSGLRPDEDVRIEYCGIRPGEKMFEQLNRPDEAALPTRHDRIRVFAGPPLRKDVVDRVLEELRAAVGARDAASVVLCLKEAISDYSPSTQLLRRVFDGQERRLAATASS
jgi:FlaA1/EpsC-like NDP-sugar epimerase